MANILHANATTTPRIREEIQKSMESAAVLAKRYNLNIKTIYKWRKAGRTADNPSGPTKVRSVLSDIEQQVICEFRRVTRFSLDDVFIALKDKIPALSRSNLHRCLQRNGLSVRPPDETQTPKEKKSFKDYPMGFVHMDITTVHTDTCKCYLFVAIDRATKYVYVEIYETMTMAMSCLFLSNLLAHCPFKITKILTDNGAQFTYALLSEHLRPKNKTHPFDEICMINGIDHRLTKFRHPWTNGQVEVTNRILKSHTTKTYHYETIESLKQHLMAFVMYYNHERKLKALKYQSPFDIILKEFDAHPSAFHTDPSQMIMGLNT
jgi:transposase-like protein